MSKSIDKARPVGIRSEILAQRKGTIGPSLSVSYSDPLLILRGAGQYLYDEADNEYLDCVNNVCHVGHCHPTVTTAGQSQMAKLNTNTRYLHPFLTEYADRLLTTFPDHLEVCFFVNSGSEANELALRLARGFTGHQQIVAMEHGYHGNTQGLTDISHYKFSGPGGQGPGPHTSITPIPDPYKGKYRGRDQQVSDKYLADFEQMLYELEENNLPPAAFIVESISGCGGQVFFPDGYLKQASELVRSHGGVYIADEVQVGFGRIGSHMWAFEPQGALPDIVTLGKPMGNGHPIAAVVTTREIADAFHTGMEYFNTFGGNPVSCAIGLAVLDVLESENLMNNAIERGNQFIHGFNSLKDKFSAIGDVRGSGLFIGVELVNKGNPDKPATQLASDVIEFMRNQRVLMSTDGPASNVLKIKPPLVINESDVNRVLEITSDALRVLT